MISEIAFFKNYVFIYLAVLDLNCSIWYFRPLLQPAGSSSLTRDQTLGPLHWKCRVLAVGPPKNFQALSFLILGNIKGSYETLYIHFIDETTVPKCFVDLGLRCTQSTKPKHTQKCDCGYF